MLQNIAARTKKNFNIGTALEQLVETLLAVLNRFYSYETSALILNKLGCPVHF